MAKFNQRNLKSRDIKTLSGNYFTNTPAVMETTGDRTSCFWKKIKLERKRVDNWHLNMKIQTVLPLKSTCEIRRANTASALRKKRTQSNRDQHQWVVSTWSHANTHSSAAGNGTRQEITWRKSEREQIIPVSVMWEGTGRFARMENRILRNKTSSKIACKKGNSSKCQEEYSKKKKILLRNRESLVTEPSYSTISESF